MKKKVALVSAIVVSIILIIAIIPRQMMTIDDAWSSTSWTVYVAGWQILVIFLIAVIGLAIYLLKKK